MNKLLAATTFAAVAFAAQSAAACDWNREASNDQQQVCHHCCPDPDPAACDPDANCRR